VALGRLAAAAGEASASSAHFTQAVGHYGESFSFQAVLWQFLFKLYCGRKAGSRTGADRC
jgi:hypothetical protein